MAASLRRVLGHRTRTLLEFGHTHGNDHTRCETMNYFWVFEARYMWRHLQGINGRSVGCVWDLNFRKWGHFSRIVQITRLGS